MMRIARFALRIEAASPPELSGRLFIVILNGVEGGLKKIKRKA